MESQDSFEIQMPDSNDPSTIYVTTATQGGEITIQPLLAQGSQPRGPIIVKTVEPQSGFSRKPKLKSLLPKGFIQNISKPRANIGLQSESNLDDNVMSDGEFLTAQISQPLSSLSMSSQEVVDEISHYEVSNIEDALQYEENDIATLPKIEVKNANLFTPFNPSSLLKEESQNSSNFSDSAHINAPDKLLFPSSKTQEEQANMVKKTMVEAFVKMVVCRKVTVQTINTKTGKIYETDIRTEEEEPVVLGVDCVETTEDLANSTFLCESKEQSSCELLSSKVGSPIDGLKFLSTVSEGRPKLGKSFIKDKLLSTLKAKSLEKSELQASEFKTPNKDTKTEDPISKPDCEKEESDFEWDEELNDDSEDFVPNTYMQKCKSSKSSSNKPSVSRNANYNKLINIPKKRGRKGKWNNAIGLSSNVKVCPFCSKPFKNLKACGKHMKKGKCMSAFCCYICSLPLKDEEDLEKHLYSHTNKCKNKHFECSDCKRVYRTKAGYVKHFHNGTCHRRDDIDYEDGLSGEFACDLCPSKFSTEDYLKLHKYKVHENPKDRHTCTDCGKQFFSSQGFQKHRTMKSCTKKLKCHICGKIYANKARESFKIHMQHHRSEATGLTYNCEDCGRAYMTQMSLNKHKLSHTGVKPYKCEICGKEFSMRYMVKDHARMHTGERPYNCSLCGTAFSNKGHLGRHLRSHENGTLLKKGRPKKIRDPVEQMPQEATLKMINLGDLHNLENQSFQVLDNQVYDSQVNSTPMIIQADNNTIIIAEGWPENSELQNNVCLDGTQAHETVNVSNF